MMEQCKNIYYFPPSRCELFFTDLVGIKKPKRLPRKVKKAQKKKSWDIENRDNTKFTITFTLNK